MLPKWKCPEGSIRIKLWAFIQWLSGWRPALVSLEQESMWPRWCEQTSRDHEGLLPEDKTNRAECRVEIKRNWMGALIELCLKPILVLAVTRANDSPLFSKPVCIGLYSTRYWCQSHPKWYGVWRFLEKVRACFRVLSELTEKELTSLLIFPTRFPVISMPLMGRGRLAEIADGRDTARGGVNNKAQIREGGLEWS